MDTFFKLLSWLFSTCHILKTTMVASFSVQLRCQWSNIRIFRIINVIKSILLKHNKDSTKNTSNQHELRVILIWWMSFCALCIRMHFAPIQYWDAMNFYYHIYMRCTRPVPQTSNINSKLQRPDISQKPSKFIVQLPNSTNWNTLKPFGKKTPAILPSRN